MADKSQEDLNFLLVGRAPGKRKVRLADTNNIADLLGGDEDEDTDEDFELSRAKHSDDEEEESSEGEDEGCSDKNEEEEDSESGNDEEVEEERLTSEEVSNLSAGDCAGTSVPLVDTRKLLCGLCLNLRLLPDGTRVSDSVDVIQCDKCGIAVHECCYSNTEGTESVSSLSSSASTEPWFCEVCIAGVDSWPSCELCPVKGGALKRMDTNRWVHLLCALFNPRVCFDDYDFLSMATVAGMHYREYGKWACHACDDKLLARTGVAVKCDAGLCKLSYHVTCAQKLGLLMDDSSKIEGVNVEKDGGQIAADPWYLLCPAHSFQAEMKEKRRLYAALKAQNGKIQAAYCDKVLTKREQDKMDSKRWAFNTRFRNLKIAKARPVEKTERVFRLLHSSPEFLQAMQRKSELNGIQKQEFEREFRGRFTREMVGKIQMPPAFSSDFPTYYQEREKLIVESERKMEELKLRNVKMREAQEKRQEKCQKIMNDHKKVEDVLHDTHFSLSALLKTLIALGHPNAKVPKPLVVETKREPMEAEDPEEKTVQNGAKNKRAPNTNQSSQKRDAPKLINTCGKCEKIHDQHLLAFCETCKKHYHLKCLDPPLNKMPKKTAIFTWECSFCFMQSEESDEEEEEIDVDAPRKLRGVAERREVFRTDPFAELNAVTKRGRKRKLASTGAGEAKKARIKVEPVDNNESNHKLRKKKVSGDQVSSEANLDIVPSPPEAGSMVDVKTSRNLRHRMQYPVENLEQAVQAVLDGKVGVLQAAKRYKVPRSTIGRRVSKIKGSSADSTVNVSDPNLDQSGSDESKGHSGSEDDDKPLVLHRKAESSPKKRKRLSIDEKLRQGIQELIQDAAVVKKKIRSEEESPKEGPVKRKPGRPARRTSLEVSVEGADEDVAEKISPVSAADSNASSEALALHSYTRAKASPSTAVENGMTNGTLNGHGKSPGAQKLKAIVVEDLNL